MYAATYPTFGPVRSIYLLLITHKEKTIFNFVRLEQEFVENLSMMANSCVSMDNNNILGLLKLRIKRGVNLAIRDARTSDPYVVVNMGDQV